MYFSGTRLDMSGLYVMGVLNVTPDSFSDGGVYNSSVDVAVQQARVMADRGATFIDVGGESTRPGAAVVSVQEELDRVVPVIEGIRRETDILVSVDTSKSLVMREAVSAGASLINDVRALTGSRALDAASELNVPVCLMHMQGAPVSMQDNPKYTDVVSEVVAYLRERKQACLDAGIPEENILIDPGFGFGKSLAHNLELLQGLKKLLVLGCPLLVGLSRKSMLGLITGKEVNDRVAASVAAATCAAMNGASILRVHDVDETVDAMKLVSALKDYGHDR